MKPLAYPTGKEICAVWARGVITGYANKKGEAVAAQRTFLSLHRMRPGAD